MEVTTKTIVAQANQIWKFNSPTQDSVRRSAAANGDDPDEAVRSMPPPSVWIRTPGPGAQPLSFGPDSDWRHNPLKGRGCGALLESGEIRITIVCTSPLLSPSGWAMSPEWTLSPGRGCQ